jgi:anaerobic nitric oxide reductase transcription regulator
LTNIRAFEILLASAGPTRFAADSDLPDPYDGLVDGLDEHLEVHDCHGLPAVRR